MDRSTTRRGFLAASAAVPAVLAGCTDGSVDPEEIDTGDRPALGSGSDPVRLTVFEDFACPACRQFKTQLTPAIVESYVEPGHVRYLHADYPIPVDETWTYAVGSAARAVFEEAGNDAFWAFASAIYEHQNSYSYDVIESVADEIAGVGAAARSAAEDGTYRERLDEDRDLGDQWGVSGTPSVFVDEERVDPDPERIGSAIEERL